MIGPDLHDRNVVFFLELKKCLRHTDVIVEVSSRTQHGKLSLKNIPDHFLCRCFAVASTNGKNGDLELSSIHSGKLAKCACCIFNNQEWLVGPPCAGGGRSNHGSNCSLPKRILEKLVPVKVFANNGNEQIATISCS